MTSRTIGIIWVAFAIIAVSGCINSVDKEGLNSGKPILIAWYYTTDPYPNETQTIHLYDDGNVVFGNVQYCYRQIERYYVTFSTKCVYLNNGTWEAGKLNFTADTLFIEPGDGYIIKANYPDGSVWFGIPNEDGNFLDRNWKKGG